MARRVYSESRKSSTIAEFTAECLFAENISVSRINPQPNFCLLKLNTGGKIQLHEMSAYCGCPKYRSRNFFLTIISVVLRCTVRASEHFTVYTLDKCGLCKLEAERCGFYDSAAYSIKM